MWFNGPPGVFEFYSTNMAIICIFIQIIQYGLYSKMYLYFISEVSSFMGKERSLIL